MDNTREKLIDVFMHLDRHIKNYDEYGICYTSDFAEAVETVVAMLKNQDANGVTFATDNNVGDKWIPVTERLPVNDYGKHWKERKYYIVCLQYGRIRVARYGYKEYGWWVDSHDCVLSKDGYTEVTHWMESPEPPEEVDNG